HEFKEVFEEILGFHVVAPEGNRYLLEVGQAGNGAQVILVDVDTSSQAQQGYGEVHHVPFRLADRKSLGTWQALFDHLGLQ
ncbi:ring-cleaving dioxygenase, partial [Enterococcus faecalis]